MSGTRKQSPTRSASPRFQICALLVAKGNLTREELLANVSAEPRAFQNAVFNAKAAGHITFLDKVGRYHLTKEGKDWTRGGANLDNHRADQPSSHKVKRDRPPAEAQKRTKDRSAERKAIDKSNRNLLSAVHVQQDQATALAPTRGIDRTFRCATFNDGTFHLSKDGVEINLTATEHAEMLRYEERMAEQAA